MKWWMFFELMLNHLFFLDIENLLLFFWSMDYEISEPGQSLGMILLLKTKKILKFKITNKLLDKPRQF